MKTDNFRSIVWGIWTEAWLVNSKQVDAQKGNVFAIHGKLLFIKWDGKQCMM